MTNSSSSPAPQSNQEAIADFHKAFRNRKVEVGEVLMLPDVGQLYEVVGHKFWKKKDSKFYTINLVFETECVVCEQPFEIVAHRSFKGLARTCPDHRGQWKNPHRAVKSHKKRKARGTPHHDAVRKTLEAYSLLDNRALVDTVVSDAVKLLPRSPGERDTRRQSVRRAIRTMAEKGLLGCALDGDYFIFE